MFIEFAVRNYKSIRDQKTLSMVSSNYIKEFREQNVFTGQYSKSEQNLKQINLLKSAAIYGANASGKSNLVDAMRFMRTFVLKSSTRYQAEDTIPVIDFKLDAENENKPSLFEIHYIRNQVKYRYGFELDSKKVYNEWLFYSPHGKETKLFSRENDKFKIGQNFKGGKGLETRTRTNALFLSVCAQFNVEIAKDVLAWFRLFNIISGLNDRDYIQFTMNQIPNEKFRQEIVKFLKVADFGIEDIEMIKQEIPNKKFSGEFFNIIKEDIKKITDKNLNVDFDNFKVFSQTLYSVHKKFNKNKKYEDFPFHFDAESQGTKKALAIAGPIIDTLAQGKVLIVDELDTKLHPLITKFIIQLFNSPENKKNSQLIFTTHDTNLLDNTLFRRDQIWFTEKNRFGITDLYSLSDYKVRGNAHFEKEYIQGRYGAIPFVGDPASFFS